MVRMSIWLLKARLSSSHLLSRVGVPQLAAAVSNAGGLGASLLQSLRSAPLMTNRPLSTGILTALTQPSPAALRDAIRETRTRTTKPFGVNITLLPSINPPDYEGYARAAVEEGVKIFETAGNNRASSVARMAATRLIRDDYV
jgi:NADH:quinone reductase (non-electrogenic)